ncbi:hypothetical protein GOP47_0010903 [Adiantum capillus-veneris]|uniref:EVE domain-containing protein n=1 Tax=Adiantum capillus-veneris TaxID=13818 RepID=A0A9D4UW84_ADICA|nr:hypothetical protein GOP47_0010903 [Adiantum capillus-veneris]
MAGRWLLKTEPEEWSWEHQQANRGISQWDGVRNAQAQKHLRAMELGDLCFFYHSGSRAKEIVGIARVCKTFYPDPSDASRKHGMVDIEAVSKLSEPLSLSRLKQEDGLLNFIMFRQPRLSVIPISTAEWNLICEVAGELEPPLRLDVNCESRRVVNEQALELGNGEASSRMCRTDQKPSSPHHNADVSSKFSDHTAQCDDKTKDVSSSQSLRQPKKRKTSGSVSPSEALQTSSIKPVDFGSCAPSDSIMTKAIKFVPDLKRVYSRRSRKQGEVEPLLINAEVNDSRDIACADARRVYKRRNR